MTTPEERAREALKLDGFATPGPWCRWLDQDRAIGNDGSLWVGDDGPYGSDYDESNPTARCFVEEDAELIAKYRTLAPELARDVLELSKYKAIVEDFIADRKRYVKELQATPATHPDWGRWEGGAEARRQLQKALAKEQGIGEQ